MRIDPMRRAGGEQRDRREEQAAHHGIGHQHALEAEAAENRRGGGLHGDGANGGCKGQQPRLHRVQSEAELQHQRQQEGERADADAIEEPADHAGEEGIDLEQAEIEQRRRRHARVPHIEHAADDARRKQAGDRPRAGTAPGRWW